MKVQILEADLRSLMQKSVLPPSPTDSELGPSLSEKPKTVNPTDVIKTIAAVLAPVIEAREKMRNGRENEMDLPS